MRLTENNKGDYYYPECIERCDGVGTSEKCDECDFCYAICEKLGEYEDLEEQGRLIKLPEAKLKELAVEKMSDIGKTKSQTNADRIRNMSDEELGDLLQSVSSGAGNGSPFISLCVDDNEITMNFSDIYEWLQSEVE